MITTKTLVPTQTLKAHRHTAHENGHTSIIMTANEMVSRVTPPMKAPAPISANAPGSTHAQGLGVRNTPGGALHAEKSSEVCAPLDPLARHALLAAAYEHYFAAGAMYVGALMLASQPLHAGIAWKAALKQLDAGDENACLATCLRRTPHGIQMQLVASGSVATSRAACRRLGYIISPSA